MHAHARARAYKTCAKHAATQFHRRPFFAAKRMSPVGGRLSSENHEVANGELITVVAKWRKEIKETNCLVKKRWHLKGRMSRNGKAHDNSLECWRQFITPIEHTKYTCCLLRLTPACARSQTYSHPHTYADENAENPPPLSLLLSSHLFTRLLSPYVCFNSPFHFVTVFILIRISLH